MSTLLMFAMVFVLHCETGREQVEQCTDDSDQSATSSRASEAGRSSMKSRSRR